MKKIFLLLIITTAFMEGQQLAFPEAVGHGRFAVGGTGGTEYVVTNLNNSGAGSFREAVEASGSRNVTFAVSGNIDLGGNGLVISNPNITINGSTAPNQGVAIINGAVVIVTSEVIIRYVRIRLGDGGYKDINGNVVGANGSDSDTILINSIGNSISNIIIDHCSVSWSIDENLSSFGGTGLINNVSVTNCILSHGLNQSHHSDGGHSMGSLFNYNTRNISVIGNLYFGNGERHLRLGAGVTSEFHNNIVYGFSSGMVVGFGTQVDMENNNFVQGNYSLNFSSRNIIEATSSGAEAETGTVYVNTDTNYYISGNVSNAFYPVDGGSPTAFNATTARGYNNPASVARLVDSGYSTVSIAQAEANIIADAGAILPSRDSYDTQLISDLENDVLAELIDTQLEVGGFPTLDGNAPIVNATGVSLNPNFTRPQVNGTVQLTAEFVPSDTTDQTGNWVSDSANVSVDSNGLVTAVSEGGATVLFTSNDGGFQASSTFFVLAQEPQAPSTAITNKKRLILITN